jgi:hypothetical protein
VFSPISDLNTQHADTSLSNKANTTADHGERHTNVNLGGRPVIQVLRPGISSRPGL